MAKPQPAAVDDDCVGIDDGVVPLLDRVADVRGTAVTDLPPLQESLDVDALVGLVASDFSGTCRFTYAGCEVVVAGDGSVEVRELAGTR